MIEEITPVKENSPKCHAERCPNCNGFGSLAYGKKMCISCNGKGIIIVPNDLVNDGGKEDAGGNK